MNKLKKFVNFANKVKGKLKIRKQYITTFICALILCGFYQVLKSDPSTRDAILAFTTVIMAFAAFWAIQSANSREENRQKFELNMEDRERKERLLNEIIEWAISLKSRPEGDVAKDLANIQIRGNILFDLRTRIEKIINDISSGSDKYMLYISKKLGAELKKAVNDTVQNIDKYNLEKSASKVIGEAAKIKTRDIS
jgi:hypothetical protein